MKVTLTMLVMLFCASSVWCQEVPKAELFGGYSYLNFDAKGPSGGLLDRQSLHGWGASAAFSLNRWVGIEGDFSGHYIGDCFGVSGLTCKHLSFMGGPRFTFRRDRITAFAHGLFGADNGSLSISHISTSDTPFALAAGGGLDYSVRFGQVDYFMTRHLNDLGLAHQNNIRVSAGIVFRFGGDGETSTRIPHERPGLSARTASSSEAVLLGVAGYETDDGLKVTSVRAGSPAAQIGIKLGDSVSRIDGRQVHSGHDIEAAIAANASGTVRVSYLIQGTWLTEREIKVR
jgi:hypothetical protein